MQLWKGICRSADYSTLSRCIVRDLRVRIFFMILRFTADIFRISALISQHRQLLSVCGGIASEGCYSERRSCVQGENNVCEGVTSGPGPVRGRRRKAGRAPALFSDA